ncbi:putative leucine-rich repeat-containing protein DDB_G0290503 isoform X3 [Diaphorina citri]|uniref:E3 ubiquitin-protein ligase CHFR n=1 Tax=Diaphorina citri TaxID=121845 RepID=A0A3Q0IPM3_DIACI|nr:putative leucine-rich repeat-containing protein DDB_G0290503 isoform X3 [Diaphorina citri]XP_026678237.1 putative leucine-rich repeat-containing protein DDB_G0290503 isoform X3 [Diaphorina citri]XP_026678239.1 putative leucine-rich repeat-containing protein DDB_G0290503 isoform X3 [Diaphorina citri]KAI5755359.1 hypothetical protein M8J77_016189 [Diaphorina citri]
METTDDESIVVEVTQDDNFEIIKMEEAFEEISEENNSPILILDDIGPANNELDLNAKDISNSENDPIIIVASLNTNELIVDDLKFNIDKNKEFLIGRSQQAAIDIRHQAISRNHCIIGFVKNKAFVKNMSSVGMFVNKNFMKNKNEICFLTSGDKIMLSEKVPEFILKYYDDISHVPVFELKTLNENLAIINRKRKLLADSEQNTDQAKKSKRDSQTEQKRQLEQERVLLNESFTQRLSVARKNYDSQVQDITSTETHKFSAEDIEKKTEELRLQFNTERNLIEAEYATQLKIWEAKCAQIEENFLKREIELKAENEKQLREMNKLKEETEDLKEKLKEAEELIKIGQKELEKENENKREIIEHAKQELEEAEKIKEEALREKQEALKKCLENESIQNFLRESNEQLTAKYEAEIQTLYATRLELEKKIETKVNEKNTESESIINQLSNELDTVRELLTIHENETRQLEAEVQSKVTDFAEVLESEAQCTICSEIFVNAITLLGCFHTFCEFCITEWKKQKQECPICRHKIVRNQEKRNFLIDNWIKSFIDKMSPAMKSAREEVVRIRAQQAQNNGAPHPIPQITPAAVAALAAADLARLQRAVQLRRGRRVHRTPENRGGATRSTARSRVGAAPPVQAGMPRPPANVALQTSAALPHPVSSSPLNANAPVFLPSSVANNSVLVINPPRVVNAEPIYVGDDYRNYPNPAIVPAVRNPNPIVISDEE